MIAHIGYHKTGSTFLQKKVFPYIDGFNFHAYAESDRVFRALSLMGESDHSVAFDEKALYSYEGLSGPMGTGLHQEAIADWLLSQRFSKIIISIRKQDALLESVYRQYLQQGGRKKSVDFLQNPGLYQQKYFDFQRLVKCYQRLFGLESVLILPQELLFNAPNQYGQRLEAFLGTPVSIPPSAKAQNQSISKVGLQLLRMLNQFQSGKAAEEQMPLLAPKHLKASRLLFQKYLDPLFIRPLFGNKDLVDTQVKAALLESLKPANKALAEECGLELSSLGYY